MPRHVVLNDVVVFVMYGVGSCVAWLSVVICDAVFVMSHVV